MARIVIATYMVRYPLGGMLSWALQYCLGFHLLGHEIHLVEKANYPGACFNPKQRSMTDSCQSGFSTVKRLLSRFGLGDRLAFRDVHGRLYGVGETGLAEIFRSADLLIDIGNHGAWLPEAREAGLSTVLIEGEPGFTQIKMANAVAAGEPVVEFDYYYSNGANIGTPRTTAPDGGRKWGHVFNPVATDLITVTQPPDGACFSTVMNWQSHQPVSFNGHSYGQKDIEFSKFIGLPARASVPVEVAAAGNVPRDELRDKGWRLCDAHEVTATFDAYHGYIARSLGEFSVCKNVFVATLSGWFSDRSAAYLASGRPVVLQDTGFSEHIPCGRGLFAVSDVEEAAAAIDNIMGNYSHHASCARELGVEYLDAKKLMGQILDDIQV
ncbi:MAG: hypothetical protein U9P11_09570 [Pseudomonadota bacterium]|nr:hypothetical protein [Pseudomonadota bacterium]